jgi:putative peptide zinc metalloprotease protein
MLVAGGRLMLNWDQLQLASGSVFAPDNWLWLMAAWMLLKVVHETAHGLVCQRYGGSVRETGVILAFFAPLAYVDVSSCWRFSSRWQRIHVAAAGMSVELLLASAAVLGFGVVDSDVGAHLLYNVIVMASVSTLLFNANPLMRFDGYYIMSDLLEIPNLYTRASEAVGQLLQRILLGQHSSAPTISGKQIAVLRCYGIAAVCWRLLICSTMLIAASVMFHGAGVALAVAGMIAWFGMPVWKTLKQVRQVGQAAPLRLMRAGVITLAFCGLVAGFLFGLPVPFSTTAPGIVSLPEGCRVHSDVSGFIQTLQVVDGQQVVAGELLLTLRNEEITHRHLDLERQIQQELIRQQIAMKEHDAGGESSPTAI